MGEAVRRSLRARTFAVVAMALLLLAMTWSLSRGTPNLSLSETWNALLAHFSSEKVEGNRALIVGSVRLPRVLVASLAGASLALAGATMQAVFKNPLASPEVMGTMMGAALGSVLAIVAGWSELHVLATPLCALVVAAAVSLVVWVIAAGPGGVSVTAILLAGVAMNSLLGAGVAFVTQAISANPYRSGDVMFWLMGGLESKSYSHAAIIVGGLLGFGILIVPFVRELDLLTLRDDGASSLGVNVPLVRNLMLLAACGLTATTVANTGGIAFVGLVVPHLVRMLVGPAHRVLLPCSAVAGALVLVVADSICRVLVTEVDLKLGVVTSALGAPFFLALLWRHRRGESL